MNGFLYALTRPFLNILDPEQAHRVAIAALRCGLMRGRPATDDPIYEYACHEANYSLENILRGARKREADEAAKKQTPPKKLEK